MEYVSFMKDWPAWLVWSVAALLCVVGVLVILGAAYSLTNPATAAVGGNEPGLEFEAWISEEMHRPESTTYRYWPYIDEMMTAVSFNKARVRGFRAQTRVRSQPKGKVAIQLNTLALSVEGTEFRPTCTALIFRRRDDLVALVNIDPASGKPRNVTLRTSQEWTVDAYETGERLEIIVFVVTNEAQYKAVENLKPSGMFNCMVEAR